MYIIGANPYAGVFTEDQFLSGKIPSPGTRAAITTSEGTKEFIVVKFNASATHISGSLITIDGDNVATLGTAGGPALTVGGRAGVLVFASATATQTVSGTAFAWAQVYGKSKVRAATISSAIGTLLQLGADGVAVVGAAGSASAQLDGITTMASQAAAGLLSVLLQYPKFQGIPA